MKQIFNELWFSFVLWKWNWIGLSYEIEEWDKEVRWFGWKMIKMKSIKDIYFRFWLFKRVLIISSKTWFKIKLKNKYGFKMILWFSD